MMRAIVAMKILYRPAGGRWGRRAKGWCDCKSFVSRCRSWWAESRHAVREAPFVEPVMNGCVKEVRWSLQRCVWMSVLRK